MRLSVRADRFYRRQQEPEKATFLRLHCRPGSTTLDIGANFGVFTVIMARAVGDTGRVLAIEPTPSTCRALQRTVAQNGCQSIVEVYQAAASLTPGTGVLHLSENVGDMGNSLIEHSSAAADELAVPLVTVDGISAGADVSCLKIDAEGAELDILRGSQRTLARCRPALTVEVHPWLLDRGLRLAIWELLARCDYEVRLGGRCLDREAFLLHESPFEIQALPCEAAGSSR